MNRNSKKGFTIVELIIVIAVIAVLAAVLIPTFSNLIQKANVAADQTLIKNLNTALAMDTTVSKHETMTQALEATKANGFDVEKIVARATDNKIVWDSANDCFAYIEKGKSEPTYIPDTKTDANVADYQLWTIVDSTTLDTNFSSYIAGTNATGAVVATKGVDVGENTGITAVSYKNTGDKQDVVIRTNSASTTLTIDDESEGSIYHYGSAGALNIIECHTASYHEYGQVAFAEIATGRIVLESGSEMKHIHINANAAKNGFDTVIIADNGAKALPETISRDEVTVTERKLVVEVESNGSTEQVYVYANGAVGTTEKTESQNSGIVSSLGMIVLDSTGNAGEKAFTTEDKEDKKEEVVHEAIREEALANIPAPIGMKISFLSDFNVEKIGDKNYYVFKNVDNDINNIYYLDGTLTLDKPICIKNGQQITLDLYGNVICFTTDVAGTTTVIENKGTFTLKDSTDVEKNGTGAGKVTTLSLSPDTDWDPNNQPTEFPGYANNTINNVGVFTLESGLIENTTSGNGACYAVDNNSSGSNATFTMNGGKLYQTKNAVLRMFAGGNNKNTVIINGGVIEGSRPTWLQLPSSSGTPEATLTINGGTFISTDVNGYYMAHYSYTFGASYSKCLITINDGEFFGNVFFGGGRGKQEENGHEKDDETVVITGGIFHNEVDSYGDFNATVTGGTFSANPTAHVNAATHTVIENADGTWTVSAK